MKKLTKLISIVLAIVMCLTLCPQAVFAFEQNPSVLDTAGGTAETPVVLNVTPANFSVTVPTGLPITVTADGAVSTADSAKLINNSAGAVKVTNVAVEGQNDWALVNFNTDPTTFKVDEKKVGLQINTMAEITADDGTFAFDATKWSVMTATDGQDGGDDECEFIYDAILAPQSTTIADAVIANVIFTVDWYKAEPVVNDEVVAGLYQTGAIALYNEQGAEAIEGMMITPWDELMANDVVHVDGGVVYADFDPNEWVNEDSDALDGDLIMPADGSITAIGNSYWDDELGDYVGHWGFTYCENLTGVLIPASVTAIGEDAFSDCSSLTAVELPDTLTSIGNYAFSYCSSLTEIVIPEGVTSIGNYAFYNCTMLKNVTFGENSLLTTISYRAFEGCTGLTSIEIPDSVTSIGTQAFEGCKGLTNIEIPDSVTFIGDYAFDGCTGLTSVTIGNGVTSINSYAFNDCTGLISVTIGSGVTSIGDYAFYDCTGLTSVTIGSGVTSIGDYAFSSCTALTAINVPWAEGAVAGAPWGATNATINYNYTGE